MTSFLNIYGSAIAEIDDPDLTYVFNQNPTSPIQFYKILYQFLSNAWTLYNNPITQITKLTPQNPPVGVLETFTGGSSNYHLSTTPYTGAYFEYKVSGSVTTGTYNSTSGCVTFTMGVPIGETGSVEWYFPGEFVATLTQPEIVVLGKLLILEWADKEKNYLSDIRRALMDTDFKMTSEGVIMNGKDRWLYGIRDDVNKLMNANAWGAVLYNYSKGNGFGF